LWKSEAASFPNGSPKADSGIDTTKPSLVGFPLVNSLK